MKCLALLLFLLYFSSAKNGKLMKQKYCSRLRECVAHAQGNQPEPACGVRRTRGKHHFKVFTNKCELLQFGCQVEDYKNAYKIIKMKYCERKHIATPEKSALTTNPNAAERNKETQCDNVICSLTPDRRTLCAISRHNDAFKVRHFINRCELQKYNCRKKRKFIETYDYICSTLYNSDITRRAHSAGDNNELDEDVHVVNVPPLATFDIHIKAASLDEPKVNKNRCEKLQCTFEIAHTHTVCGITQNGTGFKTKLFSNKCELWKYNCLNILQYFETDVDLCSSLPLSKELTKTNAVNQDTVIKTSSFAPDIFVKASEPDGSIEINKTRCAEFNCSSEDNENVVCGIRQYGKGFKIKLFSNNCELWKYNCHKKLIFFETDLYICSSLRPSAQFQETVIETTTTNGVKEGHSDVPTNAASEGLNDINNEVDPLPTQASRDKTRRNFLESEKKPIQKNILMIVNGSMFDFDGNPNHTIENFFKATHKFPVPIRDVSPAMNKHTRRVLVKTLGPVQVYEPWTNVPEITNTTFMYQPLLSSCFHRCPELCPEIYDPVCGFRASNTLLPAVMFKNHCYMDAASCYLHWNKYNDFPRVYPPPTYVAATWMFCMGDASSSAASRLMPALRVLQHMGRIKKNSKFYYQFRNMRNFNELHKKSQSMFG